MRNNTNRGRREKGFAVLLTTLTMFVTIPLAGLAFDLGTCYLIRARLGVAVDAASLAAARALSQGADQPTQDAAPNPRRKPISALTFKMACGAPSTRSSRRRWWTTPRYLTTDR